ncbi:hypothetical protein M9458_032935, partial [Cirrhinus mrigala]
RHPWLSLAEMREVDKVHFLDAPISQAGLFGDTFSAVQKQTKANHILARRGAPSATAPPRARAQSAHRHGRPSVSSRAAPP